MTAPGVERICENCVHFLPKTYLIEELGLLAQTGLCIRVKMKHKERHYHETCKWFKEKRERKTVQRCGRLV